MICTLARRSIIDSLIIIKESIIDRLARTTPGNVQSNCGITFFNGILFTGVYSTG